MLHAAARSSLLERWATSAKLPRGVAMRFLAGEQLQDGLRVATQLREQGKRAVLDQVGEHAKTEVEAREAASAYAELIVDIAAAGLTLESPSPSPAGASASEPAASTVPVTGPREAGADSGAVSVAVKPTQLGLTLDADLARTLLEEVVATGERHGVAVELDMEDHRVTEPTLELVHRLHASGHRHVACALQAYLHRTLDDCRRLSQQGIDVRLTKGAYAEPSTIAYQGRPAVARSYAWCVTTLLARGAYPRLATHDDRLIAYTRRQARRLGRGPDSFEFQMLYGVRADLQDALVAEGYRVRVYVPFGRHWYPYFMRRLAERPANLAFFARASMDALTAPSPPRRSTTPGVRPDPGGST